MRWRTDESGMALIEAIVLVVLLLVPIVWTLGSLSQIHRAALAASSAAREAAVAAARSVDPIAAARAGRAAATAAFRDQGLSPRAMRLETTGVKSLQRGAEVSVRIRYPVRVLALPWMKHEPAMWVRAVHSTEIDRYRSRE